MRHANNARAHFDGTTVPGEVGDGVVGLGGPDGPELDGVLTEAGLHAIEHSK